MRTHTFLIAIFAAFLFVCPSLRADQPFDEVARQLLVDHWEKSSANRNESKSIFENAVKTEQVLWAYTLNRMKHNRYREARYPADQLTQLFPANLDGWVLRIWLDTVTKNYDQALNDIQMLKRQVDANPNLDAAKWNDVHMRVARILGFMQGPVSQKVNATALADTLTKVANGMTAAQLQMFQEEMKRTLDQFDQREKDRAVLRQSEDQKNQAKVQTETNALNMSNQQLDQRRQQIQPDMARLRQESQQQLANLDAQLRPLQSELAGLSSRLSSTQFNLRAAYNDLAFQQELLCREEDPGFRRLIRDRIRNLDFAINTLEIDLVDLRSRANQVANQADQLGYDRAQIANSFSSQLNQLSEESNQVNRQTRKNNSRLIKLASGTNGTPPKVRGAEIEDQALRNYDPFPVDLARQTMLDLF